MTPPMRKKVGRHPQVPAAQASGVVAAHPEPDQRTAHRCPPDGRRHTEDEAPGRRRHTPVGNHPPRADAIRQISNDGLLQGVDVKIYGRHEPQRRGRGVERCQQVRYDDRGGDPVKIDEKIDQANDGKNHPAVGIAFQFE
ncbi:MAG: hypothetical protein HGJ93_15705 [Desulfosarcina sp.]|nr:hypothetical protein [Desulfosarcina sp.]MBC2767345.1 hypothetical protein [Desulfosarcina sp.]